jgi:hypothetical protein
MKKIFLKTALITMAGVCVLAGSAMATPITGGLSMTGSGTPILADGTGTTIPFATGIDFGGWYQGATDNSFVVATTTGSYVGLEGNTSGIINNFQFDSFTPMTLWSVGTFSFVMDSVTYKKVIGDNNNTLTVRGLGTLSADGLDDTPGNWVLTSEGAGSANFAWSATADSSPVPEPATMLLFGTGLLGLAFNGRKFRK